jgi:hypothetical protein
MDDAKTALAEARRLNPKLTIKWMGAHAPNLPPPVRRPAQDRTAGRMTGVSPVVPTLLDNPRRAAHRGCPRSKPGLQNASMPSLAGTLKEP